MTKLTYADAVKRAEDWAWRAYPQGYMTDKSKEALAVLKRAGKVMEAAEKAVTKEPNKESFGAYFKWETDEDAILRAALAYKEQMGKDNG